MFEFKLPDLGEGVAEGEVLEWYVSPGDPVSEDDVLGEVETDKAAVDVPSPVDGVVRELHAQPGEIVQVGEVIVTIDEDGESADADASDEEAEPADAAADSAATDGETAAASHSGNGRVFAPPSVRRLAREEGIDITTVEGSGPGGRITEADVEAAAESETVAESDSATESGGPTSVVSRVNEADEATGADAEGGVVESETPVRSAVRKASADELPGGERRDRTLATPATRRVARELGVDIDSVPTDQTRDGIPYVDEATIRSYVEAREAGERAEPSEPTPEPATGERREPYRGIRRRIGEQMARSRREIPHATHHDMVEVSGLVDARERLEPLADERDVRLTYTPFVLKCVAAALEAHPILNTELDTEAEEIVYKTDYNLGVATATDHGLLVPVVDDVDQKGLLELAREVNDLVERARAREIEREEMQGGTFTITNFGAIGGEYADPVINVPETAILGIGALKERPVVSESSEAQRASGQASGAAASSEVVAKPTLTLSLAIDHRVIDGADAAQFVQTLKSYLSDPTRLLLE